ncbi:hypothetical protein ACFX2I_045181 [Malus domestica]
MQGLASVVTEISNYSGHGRDQIDNLRSHGDFNSIRKLFDTIEHEGLGLHHQFNVFACIVSANSAYVLHGRSQARIKEEGEGVR